MKLFLAGLSAAVFVYLLVGFTTGWAPKKLYFQNKKKKRKKKTRQVWLNQAGARVSPQQFWGISLGVGVSTFVLLIVITGTPVVALVPALIVGFLPRMYFGRVRRRLAQERAEAWPDAIRALIASISASQSLHQALKTLSTGGPVPLRSIFMRYAQLSQTLDQRGALEAIKEELADPVSDRVVEVLLVALEAGPSIVLDILRDLAQATSRDVQLLEKLETAQTEQKINARAVFVMPFLLLIVLVSQGGGFREFYSSAAGLIVILFGSGLLALGMFVVSKLGRVPEERRVFASEYRTARYG